MFVQSRRSRGRMQVATTRLRPESLEGSKDVPGSAVKRDRIYVAQICALAAVYYGAAKLGLNLAFATSSVTAIWPPTGIALAALVLLGFRVWPGVALGAFLANL